MEELLGCCEQNHWQAQTLNEALHDIAVSYIKTRRQQTFLQNRPGNKDKNNERKVARQRKIEEEQTILRKAPPNTLTGTVSEKEATLLLDTGAEISLITEEWISNDRLDGRYVMVDGPGCTESVKQQ